MTRRIAHYRRSGFMLIEFMIALAFLALATALTLKMHQARVDFDRTSMQRLTDQLRIENIAERLAVQTNENLLAAAEDLASEAGVRIEVVPFESASVQGWHIEIATESETAPLRHHVWRLETKP